MAGGVIMAHYDSDTHKANVAINNDILAFSPITHAGSIEWNCKSSAGSTVENKYRPSICRD